jgi:dTDP-4-dehydrorhamnose reductase
VHFAPNQGVTKYAWAKEIANQFALDDSLIQPIEGVAALADRPLDNRMIFTRTDLLMSTRARELVKGLEFLSTLISDTDLRSFI